VTTTVKNFEHLLLSHDTRCQLRDLVFEVAARHDARLFGYVIMTNHVHLLIGVKGGGPDLSSLMRDIKSLSWRRLFPGRAGVWMARFDDVAIFTEEQFRVKLAYIHHNPVRAGLVARPEDYEFSSAALWLNGTDDGPVWTKIDMEWPSGRDA
jgi:putative transposase